MEMSNQQYFPDLQDDLNHTPTYTPAQLTALMYALVEGTTSEEGQRINKVFSHWHCTIRATNAKHYNQCR